MPDADDTQDEPTTAFESAKTAIAARLADLGVSSEMLRTGDLGAYPAPGFAAGWRMPAEFSDGLRRVDLLLPFGFPWQPSRIALVDRPSFLDLASCRARWHSLPSLKHD